MSPFLAALGAAAFMGVVFLVFVGLNRRPHDVH